MAAHKKPNPFRRQVCFRSIHSLPPIPELRRRLDVFLATAPSGDHIRGRMARTIDLASTQNTAADLARVAAHIRAKEYHGPREAKPAKDWAESSNTQVVRITESAYAHLSDLADAMGLSRHALLLCALHGLPAPNAEDGPSKSRHRSLNLTRSWTCFRPVETAAHPVDAMNSQGVKGDGTAHYAAFLGPEGDQNA